ncbi:hypothetical protein JYU14_04165 [Simkania negevensis]|uniref:Uncharacterized protein n=1 Tax=Simkania negevensis TaxID=83561 RepID=A0ABS3AUT9_9BACT|nr:hypothetical protein [Simkania negevensis]
MTALTTTAQNSFPLLFIYNHPTKTNCTFYHIIRIPDAYEERKADFLGEQIQRIARFARYTLQGLHINHHVTGAALKEILSHNQLYDTHPSISDHCMNVLDNKQQPNFNKIQTILKRYINALEALQQKLKTPVPVRS